ncbi:MAG TPA: hypothetical protein VK493_08910 [Bryobacteraceae bacterium]|nr:hypothetical protein [Bryobacteraceae bacterium]
MADIDQRLDRLTDRHEALTQTVEHLAHQGEEQNARIDKLLTVMEGLVEVARDHERRLDQLGG